ncbi:uncharacterized protein L969DRAFT_52708 [Mixia osmundae IAM 14324]|uniref:Uncharacterized protein n=1 Tax=Mixia osmundae (strain CBS 9802 / IAM 14324 / JCM 22182 / KY 12970) TaxID=764103 RepID=G7EA70_MIXOS|nr:uncharacterized protein L969DRAFT_52708 [Mixia osmundae IAM 14324]KEI37628.1 hypothetical protein L969DRAFT_52708 [Mixia osmundae IAM 14324]GAA99730.1 hypothetical protein E5Q_06433 [Mixia osmundae IAM 14324]
MLRRLSGCRKVALLPIRCSSIVRKRPYASAAEDSANPSGASLPSVRDAVVATLAGVAVLAVGGVIYSEAYKWNVLRKIGIAFEAGFDPILALNEPNADGASAFRQSVKRPEQALVADIINGRTSHHYYLFLGPKGAGKTSMIVESMRECKADGVAVFDAHQDLNVFALRFCKALNYENLEDSINGLFNRRDPREAGPLLDIERALNKLEKVAMRFRQQRGRPLVLVINNLHYLHDDQESWMLLHLFQQRAESWAQSNVLTMLLLSDSYWVHERLQQNASRMQVVTCNDLSREVTIKAIVEERRRLFNEAAHISQPTAEKLFELIGGRVSFLTPLVAQPDMLQAGHAFIDRQRAWLLSRCGLIPEMDDDVMDEQKFASCSFLLFQALAREPSIPMWRAREIMTRPDYLHTLDLMNIIHIDVNHIVRADSQAMLNIFKETTSAPHFASKLAQTRDRIDEIESLGRTRELLWK